MNPGSRVRPTGYDASAAIPQHILGETEMSELEQAQKQAEEDFRRNQQAQMAEEHQIRDAAVREAYNAELARQRQLDEDRRRQQG